MIRRFAPLALASTLILGACGSGNALSKSDVLAVNGTGYSLDDLNAVIDTLVETKQLSESNGKVAGDDLKGILRVIIKSEAYKQFKSSIGLTEDPAIAQRIKDTAAADKTFATYPKVMQDLLLDLNIAEGNLEAAKIPATSRIKALYEKNPASSGVLCLSHILVKTESEARQILKDLAEGADFAATAGKKSIDPSGKSDGGKLTDDGARCQTLGNAQATYVPEFVRGAVAAKAGVPSGPVKSQFGWHIILNAAYDDVADDITTALGKTPMQNLIVGYMATADIRIASTYGTWDGATASIN